MVSIVAHGIFGTSYMRQVVVDGGAGANGDINALNDIRRQISNEYDDGSPMIGWALQPSPSGMWLSRIERAFDLNYAPAYVEVSFLIPRGKRFDDAIAVLDMISNQMVLNYFKYIRQNVIQALPDWSFLTFLGNELENHLVADYGSIAAYKNTPQYTTAYFLGNIYEMLGKMWSEKFSCVGTVFCGDGLLTKNKEFVSTEDIVEETHEMEVPETDVLEEESSGDETDELTEEEPMVAEDDNNGQEDYKSHVEFLEPACVYGPPVVDNDPAHEPELINQKTMKWIRRIVIYLMSILIGFMVIIYTVSSRTRANDNKVESDNSYIAVDSNVIVIDRPILKPAESQSQKTDSYYKENYNKWKTLFAKKEYEEALKYLLISAEGDYWEALHDLSYHYFRGNVYKHDVDLAEQYARRGAILGYVNCQLWLGQILRETGRKAEALQWFEKSGKHQGWSAYLAGEMYEKGEGTEKDINKAIEWYTISAKTTNGYASNAREALRRLGQPVPKIGKQL